MSVVTVHRASSGFPCEGALCLTKPGRTHVGVAVRVDARMSWLHFADHLQVLVEPLPDSSWWVQPALRRHSRNAVVTGVRRVCERRSEGKVAFGFDAQMTIDPDGRAMTVGMGVTCATFVARVFERFGSPLVNLESWGERTPARAKADRRVLADLARSTSKKHPKQGQLLLDAADAPRVRPEEVAAASGALYRPVPFSEAEPMGRAVLEALV